jgi:hypothetical protein
MIRPSWKLDLQSQRRQRWRGRWDARQRPWARTGEEFKFHQEKSTTVCNPQLVFLDLTFFSHLTFSFSVKFPPFEIFISLVFKSSVVPIETFNGGFSTVAHCSTAEVTILASVWSKFCIMVTWIGGRGGGDGIAWPLRASHWEISVPPAPLHSGPCSCYDLNIHKVVRWLQGTKMVLIVRAELAVCRNVWREELWVEQWDSNECSK